jgi:hypothetical protein
MGSITHLALLTGFLATPVIAAALIQEGIFTNFIRRISYFL